MPDILVAGRFIMLANRRAFASIRTTNRRGNLFNDAIYFRMQIIWYVVDILIVFIGKNENMARVVSPPFGRYKGGRMLIPVDNVLLIRVSIVTLCDDYTERADISFGFMAKGIIHVPMIAECGEAITKRNDTYLRMCHFV